MKHNRFILRIARSAASLAVVLPILAGGAQANLPRHANLPKAGPTGGGSLGFTYQGRLDNNGAPYTGSCDFVFNLWDAPSAGVLLGSQSAPGVAVTAGLFAVVLNDSNQFGTGALDGAPRWLEVTVKCPGDSNPVSLGRQKLTAGPYTLTRQQADGYYLKSTGPDTLTGSLDVEGVSNLNGDVTMSGALNAPVKRYAPITVGDMMISPSQSVYTGDYGVGPIYPHGSQSGGTITFPLPADYKPGTSLTLDLYVTPRGSVTGTIEFFVRWVGVSTGGFGGTGGSVLASVGATPASEGYISRLTYALSGYSAPLPEFVQMTIRREPSDTYNADVVLTALRLAYQATR